MPRASRIDRNAYYNYDLLSEAFEYDPETGVITHKFKTAELLTAFDAKNPQSASLASRRWVGRRALNSWVASRKALVGQLGSRRISAARVAWVLGHEGLKDVPSHIGYADGDPRNLRLENLVDIFENSI